MLRTAPATGIAIRQFVGAVAELQESAYGYKQLFRPRLPHGEFTPDTRHQSANVGNRSAEVRVALRSRPGRRPRLRGSSDPKQKSVELYNPAKGPPF